MSLDHRPDRAEDGRGVGVGLVTALGEALSMAGAMGWEILWPLVLGFFLSGVVQAVVRRE